MSMNTEQAQRIIRLVASGCGTITWSRHAIDRMKERNYTPDDVLHIMRTGKITKREYNKRAGNWKYTVHGNDLDGDEGGTVTAILNETEIVIITVLA